MKEEKEIKLPQREIKFRYWNKKEKKMVFNPIINDIDSATNYIGLNDLFKKYQDRNFILQQFTGLLDKQGKEIYEGDILEYRSTGKWGRFIVQWNKEGFWDYGLSYEDSEVIGNIFEDRNLLTNPNN